MGQPQRGLRRGGDKVERREHARQREAAVEQAVGLIKVVLLVVQLRQQRRRQHSGRAPVYGGTTFTDQQRKRLAGVFPDGVCDWSQPGQGQVPVDPWTTFAAGPGGQPLGAAPASVPIP